MLIVPALLGKQRSRVSHRIVWRVQYKETVMVPVKIYCEVIALSDKPYKSTNIHDKAVMGSSQQHPRMQVLSLLVLLPASKNRLITGLSWETKSKLVVVVNRRCAPNHRLGRLVLRNHESRY